MTNILLATPAYGDVFYTPYVSSLVGLQRLASRNKWHLAFASIAYADIVESRNFLLTHFFDRTSATHLLFVDADMGYEPGLIADMLALRKPVVGVTAPKRQIDLDRLAKLARKGEAPERAIARAHNFVFRPVKERTTSRPVKGFVQVEGCGAGILLIERACVQAMLERLPELSDTAAKGNSPLTKNLDRLIRAFDPTTVDGARLSEDYSFCHRWRRLCGGEVWANINRKVTHVGLQKFSARYSDAMPAGPRVSIGKISAKSSAPAANKVTVKVTTPSSPTDSKRR
jgi:hypothetical protein